MKQVSIYLHSDQLSMNEKGKEIGLTGEALKMFEFACYEVLLVLEVNEETGEAKIVGVDGRKVHDKE